MRGKEYKLIVAATLIALTTLTLLIIANADIKRLEKFQFLPKFRKNGVNWTADMQEDIIIEKIVQRPQNSSTRDDMRDGLYLTNHGFLLENLAKIKVEYRENTYTLNDVCFKPHPSIFENQHKKPYYLERLHLEMRRLSPCLIVTPLNCFYDSYRVHQQISNWNSSTDFLNRRLRNSYISQLEDDEKRPYVKSEYGPELIEEWAKLMYQLEIEKENNTSIVKKTVNNGWLEGVKRWISSIQPREKVCADPIRSCNETFDAENYFNVCMIIQTMNNYDLMYNQKLKFQMDSGDVEFTTQLDCVDDREKFIEWMQEKKLRKMLSVMQPKLRIPDHQKIVKEKCDGMFRDGNDGLEIFDGSRGFERHNFTAINMEIALMTPAMIVENMRHADYVNGFESMWTVQRARELLHEFREALRFEVAKFNEHRATKKIGIVTEVVTPLKPKDVQPDDDILNINIILATGISLRILLLLAFSLLVWSANCRRSILTFLARDAGSILFYLVFCRQGGAIILNTALIEHAALQTIVNLFATTRLSFCHYRLFNWLKRKEWKESKSNFSSIATVPVDSMADIRQLNYYIAKYTKYQAAQDAFSKDRFEQITKYWWILSIAIFPIVILYWMYVDATCHLMLAAVCPTIFAAAMEEFWLKRKYLRKRAELHAELRQYYVAQGEFYMSGRSVQNRLSEERLQKRLETEPGPSKTDKNADEAAQESMRDSSKHLLIPCRRVNPAEKSLNQMEIEDYDTSKMKLPNETSRMIRLTAVKYYLALMRMERKLGALFVILAILLLVASVALLFLPVSRTSPEFSFRIAHDDVYIDFQVQNLSETWLKSNQMLKQFGDELEAVPTIRLVSNWHKSFERFEQRTNKQNSSAATFHEWLVTEPINSAIVGMKRLDEIPNLLKFRWRFEIEDSTNETMMTELEQIISTLLAKYNSPSISLKAVGLVYEHYQRNAIAWNLFAYNELISTACFLSLFTVLTLLFVTTPTLLAALLFSLFSVATRLEIAAVGSLLSLDHHQNYAYFALLTGFIAAWTPFCELFRFRSRVLAREAARLTPELASTHRIRVPFIAAVDVFHFFGILLAVLIPFAVPCALFEPLHVFLIPTVILIVIQIVAILNSIAVSAGVKLMFEPKVRQALKKNLQESQTILQIRYLTRKVPKEVYEGADGMEMGVIRPVRRHTFYAPPPPTKKRRTSTENHDEDDTVEEIDVVTIDPSASAPSNRPIPLPCSMEAAVQQNYQQDEYHRVLCGAPVDSVVRDLHGNPIYTSDPISVAEENYEWDEEEEEEEDVPLNEGVVWDHPLEQARREQARQEQEDEDEFNLGAEDEDEEDVRLDAGAGVEEQEQQEDEVERAGPAPRRIPLMIRRRRPRDPRVDPPVMEEIIQANDPILYPNLGRHPRADQYPANFSRAMVAYAEDPFWTQRIVPLPPDIPVPPRPRDYFIRPERTPTPEDFNFVPPDMPPPIDIPPEAWAAREERRQRYEEEQRHQNQNQNR